MEIPVFSAKKKQLVDQFCIYVCTFRGLIFLPKSLTSCCFLRNKISIFWNPYGMGARNGCRLCAWVFRCYLQKSVPIIELKWSESRNQQVRSVSIKAERPNHPSRCHQAEGVASQGGGVSQPGGVSPVGRGQPVGGGFLHDNDNTYMTPSYRPIWLTVALGLKTDSPCSGDASSGSVLGPRILSILLPHPRGVKICERGIPTCLTTSKDAQWTPKISHISQPRGFNS